MAKKKKAAAVSRAGGNRAKSGGVAALHREIKQKLIIAGKVLVGEGQDDFTRGHISFRLPDNPNLFFMKAHSIGLDEITMENILTIDLEGNVVAGKARRHSEVYIHSEILKVRPDINCVIHTHPTYSVALSATGRTLKCYSQPGALFYEALGTYTDTIQLIRSHAMGAGVAKALGQGRGVLLKNHGPVVAGATIEETVISTIMLENGAMVQLLAEAVGDPAPEFPRESIEQLKHEISRPDQFVVNFDYLARRAKRRGW
ncbi:MAG TPA: class II aldolase/adducin family protein [Xanthobacteraceae bacterium]|jgi:L-fuculose-phosphate aldolase|nr:class II aldolase/adducin family protein [Xanthobacteraceae bacterium]